MSESAVDFAVFGSSLLANLVAGLLASRHKRRVIIVGEPEARYRLPRALDLSIAPITRPETWALLSANKADSAKLISKIGGRTALRHVDPIFFADGTAAREALGHFSHMARAYGNILEAVAPARAGTDRKALRISDCLTINRPILEPALEAWLGELGVRRVAPQAITFGSAGTVEVTIETESIAATGAILVDDSAIVQHLPGWQWPAQLLRRPRATILTASSRHVAGPIMVQLDSGTTLVQHEEGGMAAIGPGTLAVFSARLGTLLAETGQLQQVGQVGFESLATGDGAPLLGTCSADGPTILTGLGTTGAFLAPVLARWLANEATGDEAAWCECRRPDQRGLSRSVAEFTEQAA
jgi:hypothetical protein